MSIEHRITLRIIRGFIRHPIGLPRYLLGLLRSAAALRMLAEFEERERLARLRRPQDYAGK